MFNTLSLFRSARMIQVGDPLRIAELPSYRCMPLIQDLNFRPRIAMPLTGELRERRSIIQMPVLVGRLAGELQIRNWLKINVHLRSLSISFLTFYVRGSRWIRRILWCKIDVTRRQLAWKSNFSLLSLSLSLFAEKCLLLTSEAFDLIMCWKERTPVGWKLNIRYHFTQCNTPRTRPRLPGGHWRPLWQLNLRNTRFMVFWSVRKSPSPGA